MRCCPDTVTWSSPAASVVTVSATGLVTAVGPGSSTVTATSEGKSASATITVAAVVVPVASVTVTAATTASLVATQTVQLTAVREGQHRRGLAGRVVTWSTATPAVATVSPSGLVTAVTTGSASVTATSEGRTASIAITVVDGTLIGTATRTVVGAGKERYHHDSGRRARSRLGITIASTTPAVDSSTIGGTNYSFRPDGTQFSVPVTVRIKYDPANFVAGTVQANLAMFTGSADTSVMLVGSVVDSSAHMVQATTTHFSVFHLNQQTANYTDADGVVTKNLYIDDHVVVCLGNFLSVIFDPGYAFGSFTYRYLQQSGCVSVQRRTRHPDSDRQTGSVR